MDRDARFWLWVGIGFAIAALTISSSYVYFYAYDRTKLARAALVAFGALIVGAWAAWRRASR